MKLLVFAHTPPPHHGQSYMVQLMLEGFGGDHRRKVSKNEPGSEFGIECYHVNARLSQGIHEIGGFQPRKLFALIGYCLEAIWCRFRYGVSNFYYVPAPGQRGALYRDCLVMLVCRPFFRRIIYHWHAAGLTAWLQTSNLPAVRWVAGRLLGRPDLSIVLSKFNFGDGEKLNSRQTRMVHNGIPDACPDFGGYVWSRRQARFAARQKLSSGLEPSAAESAQAGGDPHIVKLLYLAHCSREKGLFDALEAVALANARFKASGSPLRCQLTVAGEFIEPEQRRAFDKRITEPDLQTEFGNQPGSQHLSKNMPKLQPAIHYVGFLSGTAKQRALLESDCLCFPSFFHAESFGLAIIEAMAFDLPIVATRWRSIPELFPDHYSGLVEAKSPQAIVEGLFRVVFTESGEQLRKVFAQNFSLSRHLGALAEALKSVEKARP